MRRVSLLAVLMLFAMTAMAQVNKAQAEFYFGQSNDKVDPAVGNNAYQLDVLDSIAADFSKVPVQNRYVIIDSYTSPDGSASVNEQVARQRAETVERIFDSKLSTDAHVIFRPHYYEWEGIISMMRQDAELPNRDEVLKTIQSVEDSNGSLDNAETSALLIGKLKNINNGSTYKYIFDNYFLQQHKVVLEVRYLGGYYRSVAPVSIAPPAPIVEKTDEVKVEKPVIVEEKKPIVVEEKPVEVEQPVEPVVVEPEVVIPAIVVPEVVLPEVTEPEVTVPEVVKPEVVVPEVETPVDTPLVALPPVVETTPVVEAQEVDTVASDTIIPLQPELPIAKEIQKDSLALQRPCETPSFWQSLFQNLAVKTNLLYDAALLPNVAVEVAIGEHYSINADWMYAWWSRDSKHDYWRAYGGDLEFRYWFANKDGRILTGHHVGAYAGILTYDVELGGTGYMGDKWSYMFGLSYGYAIPISKKLNLDFEVGLGYFGGEYYKYEPEFGSYIWQQTKKRNWFGPTRAEVSLVWLLGR